MKRRTTGIIAGILIGVVALCCGGTYVFTLLFGNNNGCGDLSVDPGAIAEGWLPKQVEHAAVIVQTGMEQQIPPRGWVIALATAMQESGLKVQANDNSEKYPGIEESLTYPHEDVGHDHDSLGLFQQRWLMWGTMDELMDPATSAKKFYDALEDVEGWEDMSLTEAAQRVQGSAYPDAYAKWEDEAIALSAIITGGDFAAVIGTDCAAAGPGDVPVDAWIAPVDAAVWSGFRSDERPDHYGVDLSGDDAPRGTPIYAAASGIVRYSECNSPTCDIDGSPEMSGCGWMTVIDHGLASDPYGSWPGVSTRYCHMDTEPVFQAGDRVWAGQVIGVVGNTGSSSGPHLHFEVHNGTGTTGEGRLDNDTAIDPVAWMESVGAPLG